jgi:small subunit ribosomal protein S3
LGHKVHPTGFRVGVIKDWQSKWYSETHYAEFVLEDAKLRNIIRKKYGEAGISLIEIDRQAKDVTLTLYTARPGIVIGRGGQRVEEMRQFLEKLIEKKIRLNIQEVRQPELDAYLVARSIAEQIERRVAYRRAMKQAMFRTMQAGAKGIKVSCAGRLGNAEIARRQTSHQGQVPLHTLRADIDYGFTEAHTTLGRIGVKVWIYKGQILPELKEPEVPETPAEEEAPEPVVTGEEANPAVEPEVAAAPAAEEARPRARRVSRSAETTEKPAEEAAPAEAPARRIRRKTAEPAAETAEPPETVAETAEEPAAEETEAPAEKAEEPAAEETEAPAETTEEPAAEETEAPAETADESTEEKKEDAAAD